MNGGMPMRLLDGIAPIAPRYAGWVLDLWGVVHDGRALYPGVADALARLRAQGSRVVFLTNAPRRAHAVAGLLDRMGLERGLYAGIVSSGEVGWDLLRRRDDPFIAGLGRRAVHVGPARDASVFDDGVAEPVADPAQADFVMNTGPDPERGSLGLAPYLPVLEACAARGLPMLCVNPDRHVMVGGERLFCAGALADAYRAMGGVVREIGKPDPAVYAPVLAMLGVAAEQVVAVGDSPTTDLAGAQAAGIDAVWALTGLAEDALGVDPSPAVLVERAAAAGVRPIAALRALRW